MRVRKALGAAVFGAMLGATGCVVAEEDEGVGVERAASEVGDTCSPSHADGAVVDMHRALLDTIAFTEGTIGYGEDGYNVTFGYEYFSSCERHPNRKVCKGSWCSTAAGRYQFLYKTWQTLDLDDFGPANQDIGGMKLVTRRRVTPPEDRPMTATEFTNAMNRLSYEWASLPPGRYGQPAYSMNAARAKYCQFAEC